MSTSDEETLSINLNSNCLFKANYSFTPSPTWNFVKSCSKNIANFMILDNPNSSMKNDDNRLNLPSFVDFEQDFASNLKNRHCKLEQQLCNLEKKVFGLMEDINDQLDCNQNCKHRSNPKLSDGDNVLCKDNHRFLVLLIHRLLNELHSTKLQHQQAMDKMNIRYEKLRRTIKWLQNVPSEPPYLERIGAGDQCMDLMH